MALTKESILTILNLQKKFIVRCDASSIKLGLILLKEDSSQAARPVAYASRKLFSRETRFSTIERECLDLVGFIEKLHIYLYGRKFILETNHRVLEYLANFNGKNSRVLRWAISLQPYNYSIRCINSRIKELL